MKIKTTTVRMRRRGGEKNARTSRPPTQSGTRGVNPYTVGKPTGNGKALLYAGLASFFGLLLIIIIVVVASGNGRQVPNSQPVRASTDTGKRRPAQGQYGAKYAPNDPKMAMTEETEEAKARKKRRLQSGR